MSISRATLTKTSEGAWEELNALKEKTDNKSRLIYHLCLIELLLTELVDFMEFGNKHV